MFRGYDWKDIYFASGREAEPFWYFFYLFIFCCRKPYFNGIGSSVRYFADSTFQKGQSKFWDFIKRACTKLMKVLIVIQETHPFSFSDKSVLPLVMVFCLNKITDPDPDVLSFEKFLIQCMVMVKNVLECKEYKRSVIGRVMEENGATPEQMKKNISNAVNGVLNSLMTSERVVLLCNILIRR